MHLDIRRHVSSHVQRLARFPRVSCNSRRIPQLASHCEDQVNNVIDNLMNKRKVRRTRELHVAASHSSRGWEGAYHSLNLHLLMAMLRQGDMRDESDLYFFCLVFLSYKG